VRTRSAVGERRANITHRPQHFIIDFDRS
jgi:hypothetical protein